MALDAHAAGVAWVIRVLVASPVLLPLCRASSRIVVRGRSSGYMERAGLTTFRPVDQAEEAAAESVTIEVRLCVIILPDRTAEWSRSKRSEEHTSELQS